MKERQVFSSRQILVSVCVASTFFIAACGDDDSFSPISRDRGYDYAYTSAKDLSKTPCDSMRNGRTAVIGRDKDFYECVFDEQDSVYLWVSDYDTLTAEGREFYRAESSSSSDEEDSSSSRSSSSSRYSSSSVRSSSSYSNSSGSRPVFSKGEEITLPDSKEDIFNPDIDYGTMTDPRDGKVYRTVNVNGKTWMAENLNFGDSSDYPVLKQNVFCYNYKEEYCEKMGALYNRAAAMNDERCAFKESCNLGSDPIQGICPDGWHIPSKSEVELLIEYVGDAKASTVRSAKGWTGSIGEGSDLYGLSFVGTGNIGESGFEDAGEYTCAWTYYNSTDQYYFLVQGAQNRLHLWNYGAEEMFIPVRCINDEDAPILSSSSSSSSSFVTTPKITKGEQFNPNIAYGTMTDSRDGKTYKTVVVNGRTWMAENLNFAGDENFTLQEQYSLCYEDDDDNCELYGRLYSRVAAFNSSSCAYNTSCSPADPHQGACPTGWHIPSKTEAEELVDLAETSFLELTSAKGWGNDTLTVAGKDTYGLSFVAAGYKIGDNFKNFGVNTFMWANVPSNQHYFVINATTRKAFVLDYDNNVVYASIRCVKDE